MLQAKEDFDDVETREHPASKRLIRKEIRRKAGDEWLLRGPCTFIPHPSVTVRLEVLLILICRCITLFKLTLSHPIEG